MQGKCVAMISKKKNQYWLQFLAQTFEVSFLSAFHDEKVIYILKA